MSALQHVVGGKNWCKIPKSKKLHGWYLGRYQGISYFSTSKRVVLPKSSHGRFLFFSRWISRASTKIPGKIFTAGSPTAITQKLERNMIERTKPPFSDVPAVNLQGWNSWNPPHGNFPRETFGGGWPNSANRTNAWEGFGTSSGGGRFCVWCM